MSRPIIECIANYSEARRPEVVEAIIQAITSVEGVHLLDRHSDLDHNRSVVTFIGPPQVVQEAAFRSIARAAELINLDQHTGEHPRIGATDVCPFVPISGITMQEAVHLAQQLGQRVGEQLGIAVYLYEEAATRPDRQNLEIIRKGQYEGLKVEILTNPDRQPDFGPAELGPAGATVIGARQPLIAYNVYLTTDDVTIADKIAKAVRQSNGGLRYVKALGVLVEGRAQVSMNLTNYLKTPIARVVEMIRREAARYAVGVHHCELVGLIPQQALVDAAQWYLQLDQFKPEQILEQKILTASQGEERPSIMDGAFLEALAAGSATPGGGSASAYAGAAGAALVAMVARLTVNKKKYAEVEERMQGIILQAEVLRSQLAAGVQQDSSAFEQVMTAFKLPKDTVEQQNERSHQIQVATLRASQVPLNTALLAVQVMELAFEVVSHGNVNALSDGGSAAALASAALTGAGLNVRINARDLTDRTTAKELLDNLTALERRAAELQIAVQKTIQQRGGFSTE